MTSILEQSLSQIDFVTFGMFILDDIEFGPETAVAKDIIGGAGTYSALGARMLSPPPISKNVGWIVDMGHDFPLDSKACIESWQTCVMLRLNTNRKTTRGWNGYNGDDKRSFRYMTPKLRLSAADISESSLLWSKSFHFICSPQRCKEMINDLLSLRQSSDHPHASLRPILIWEPVPDLCIPSELENTLAVLSLVDICSPNHNELASLYGENMKNSTELDLKTKVESLAGKIMKDCSSHSCSLVVRVGEHGSFVVNNKNHSRLSAIEPSDYSVNTETKSSVWIPAVHDRQIHVVDPTGAGNCFLGGLGVALARGQTLVDAVVDGAVVASFAIEQIGVPILGVDEEGNETWNGGKVYERMKSFRKHLDA